MKNKETANRLKKVKELSDFIQKVQEREQLFKAMERGKIISVVLTINADNKTTTIRTTAPEVINAIEKSLSESEQKHLEILDQISLPDTLSTTFIRRSLVTDVI